MSHQYSRVVFDLSVEVVEDNLSMYYGGVTPYHICFSLMICGGENLLCNRLSCMEFSTICLGHMFVQKLFNHVFLFIGLKVHSPIFQNLVFVSFEEASLQRCKECF